MEFKQNINRVHGDLNNYFDNVKIFEKSNKDLGNYFELSILENKKEVKVIIKMTEIENANFSWEYYANPSDENSLVERVSSIYTFSSDIQDIFEKNRFASEYINEFFYFEDGDDCFDGFDNFDDSMIVGKKIINISFDGETIIELSDNTLLGVCCSGGETVELSNDDIYNEVITSINVNQFDICINFESGKKLEFSDPTGGEGIEIYKKK